MTIWLLVLCINTVALGVEFPVRLQPKPINNNINWSGKRKIWQMLQTSRQPVVTVYKLTAGGNTKFVGWRE